MPLPIGTKLGSYEIVAPIGAGGMGEVYRARDAKLGRDVALKVLPEIFSRDPERMSRFQREAKFLASLNHPNIATIHGFEDSGNTHALVMELVEGPTLADRIRSGPIPIDEALRIAKQIAEALEYAHEHGIVHRDLKPANIKVTDNESVKTLDFGLAKAIEADPTSSDISNSPTISQLATQAGTLLGTPAYMSPEQAKRKSVDRRADIWAFGCVLYEMLVGKKAFDGESVAEILAAVIRAEPDWSHLPPATPQRVRVLLRRCLQKEARQRLQAIGDARIALDEILADPAESPVTPEIFPPPWRRAVPWALFGLTALGFAAFALLHQFQLRTAVPSEPVRLLIPVPVNPPLRPTGLFAISPNGQQLAFAATSSDGVPRIWLRPMSSLDMRPLLGTEAVGSLLFWSPDSRFIAFEAGGNLQRIDISGGPAQTICALNLAGVGGSWNSDGVIIFGQWGGPIMRVSATGGIPTPLTILDKSHGDIAHTVPWFLPDGRHFIYLRDGGTAGAITGGSLDARPEQQDPRRLGVSSVGAVYAPSSGQNSGQLLFLNRGTLMAQSFDARRMTLSGDPTRIAEEPIGNFLDYGLFSVSTGGTLAYWPSGNVDRQLTWFDEKGKILGTVGDPGPYTEVALSPDGTRAFLSRVTRPDQHQSLWLLDMSRGAITRFELDPSPETVSPVWAPDGHTIAFGTVRAGEMMDIYKKALSGAADAEPLVKSNDWKLPSSWSPDGRFLLYASAGGDTKGGDLWILPVGEHKKPVPFLRTEFVESDGHFSPDGRWVAYVSDDSGRNEVYVRPFTVDDSGLAIADSGNKWLISNVGGSSPIWRADGKVMYYIDLDGKLMAVDVATQPTFHATAPRFLFQTPPKSSIARWNPSPDGKHFLFLVPETHGEVPFTVVLNWQAGLKK